VSHHFRDGIEPQQNEDVETVSHYWMYKEAWEQLTE
jgi:hypothetical protein